MVGQSGGVNMEVKNWEKDLKFGRDNTKLKNKEDIFKLWFEDLVCVEDACVEDDKKGIDYYLTLENGQRLKIDTKTRRKGTKKYWKKRVVDGVCVLVPELALETWSVIKTKTGWTKDDSKNTDYVLFLFEEIDDCFLYPFQLLKRAFKKHEEKWYLKYKTAIQTTNSSTGNWKSECIFVPVEVVWDTISEEAKKKKTGVEE